MHTTTMKEREINDEDRRLLHRVLLDIIVVVVLIIPIIICEFFIEPFRRGFFCNDQTIKYPLSNNTVTLLMLALLVTLLPALILLIVEYTRSVRRGSVSEYLLFFGKKIPIWIVEFFKHASFYCFGALLTLNATELGKFTAGRLRPHFMDACQPQLTDGSTCETPANSNRYIENYVCTGIGFADDVRQARLSFPSGHSSLIFYAMTYLIIYLQHKFTWRGSKLLRYFIQFLFLMVAWFTALSRIMDNYHHWSDVLCGSCLGIVGAILTALFITKEFGTPFLERLHANIRRQDTSTTLDEMAAKIPTFSQRNGIESPPSLNGGSSARSYGNDQVCTKV